MGRNNINKKRGKSCKKAYARGASAPRLNPVTAFIRASLPAGLLLGLPAGSALAGPEGGVVAAGEGSIATPDASTTVINQASQNLIVNWESFNVNTHETVKFNQPNRSAQALNRIFDQNPSQIFGSLNANGKVLLINPNGVFFSPTARVNVGGLVASGLNIKDEDFMAGKHTFFNQNGSEGGMVVNQGLISAATGGSVTLIGGAVKNEGTILATAGQVNLVAGKKVTMDFDGDGLIQFTVNEEILQNAHDLDDAISNTGTISADGGSVLLHGKAAKEVFTNVVNNSGVIGANKIQNEGGQIKLVASGAGNSLLNTGVVDASSSDSDGGNVEVHAEDKVIISESSVITTASETGKGGKVQITGDKVGLTGETSIDASGDTGGGEVLVGGDFQGKNPDVVNAAKTYVGKDVSITADAVAEGDGGKVIVWADDTTHFYGDIFSTGGALLGDGGFVEVSGKELLNFKGLVDLRASQGKNGTLLLDPTNIEISAAVTTIENDSGPDPFTYSDVSNDGPSPSILNVTDLVTQLALSDVIVTTASTAGDAGDITLTTNLDYDGIGTSSLTLVANNNINITGGTITDGTPGGDTLNLTLNADSDASGAGSLTISQLIETNNGTINFLAEDFIFSGAGIDAGSADIFLTETQVAGPLTFGDEFDQTEVDLLSTTGTITFGRATDSTGTVTTMDSTTFQDAVSIDFTGTGANIVLAATNTIDFSEGGDATGSTVTATNLTLDTTGGATVTQGTTTPDSIVASTLTFVGDGTITLNSTANDVDSLAASGTTVVTFTDTDAIDFAAANFTASSLNLTTGDAITDTGTITISGVTTLNANAGASAITLDSAGNDFDSDDSGDEINAAGTNITLVDTDAIELGDIDDAGDFDLTAGGAVTQTAAGGAGTNVNVTGTTSITATGNAVTLTASDNDFGGAVSAAGTNISLRDTNAIELDDIDDAGDFNLITGGAVTQTAAGAAGDNVDVSGTTSITATGFAVTLDEATNDFGDAINVSGNNITLNDADAIVLGDIDDTDSFALTAGGAVTQTLAGGAGDNINVAGTANINAGTNSIVLLSATNDFDSLTLSGGTLIQITDANALTLAAPTLQANTSFQIVATTTLTLPAAAISTGTGNLILESQGGTLTTAGTLSTTSGDITLVGSDGVSIGHDITTTTAGGSLSITTTDNAINQTAGTISIIDGTTLSAGAGAITLNIGTNNFDSDGSGDVIDASGNNITLNDTDAIILGDIDDSGDFSLTAGGPVTQNTAGANGDNIDVSGLTTIVATGSAVTLNASTNDFIDINAAGTNISLRDRNAIELSDIDDAGNLSVIAGGNITQSVAGGAGANIDVTGTSSFNAGANAVTLTTADNDFGGAVSAVGTNISLTDIGAIQLGDIDDGGDLAVIASSGAITQTGAAGPFNNIDVTGTSSFTATGNAVTLTASDNDFGGAVSAAGTNISLRDTNAIVLDDIDDAGDFTLNTGGTVTQTAAGAAGDNVDVTGTTSITATGFAVTLDETTNDFGGAVSVAGTNISLRDANAIELDDIDDAGDFTLTAGGAVTQTAAGVAGDNVDVTGTTSITATGFAVTLDQATNDFVGAVSAAGTNISLTDANSLVLGTVSDAGDFVVNFDASDGGAESLSFNNDVNVNSIVVSGTSSNDTVNLGADADITAATGDIVIGAAQNITGIDINGAGSNIITATAGAIDLTSITDSAAVAELELNAGTNITLADITLNDGAGLLDIDLDEGADGTQTLDLNGDIVVGSLTVDGQNANDTVLIGSNVDITASTGDIAMGAAQNISAVTLDGAGSNTLTATAGAIDLAALTDTANITILNLRADTGVTLDSVTLNNDPGSSILDIRFDQGGNDAAALNVTNALTVGSLGLVLGQGTNDTMTFGGLITTSSGGVSLGNAATININGGINAASNINIDAVTTVNAAAGGNSITGTAIEIRDNNNVGTFNVTGTGLLTLDASSPGTIALADITDSADADLTINAGAGITAISSVNMNGGGTLTVDVGTNAAIGAIANFVGTVTAGVIDFSGFESDDAFNIQNTLTATAGSVTIDTANSIDVADISATGAITVAINSIDLNGTSYASNDGNITLTGTIDLDAAGAVTLDSDANNDATDGSISLNGTINDNAAGDSNLIVDADTGDVSLNAIGTTTQIGDLTITGNDITFNGNVESGLITATGVQNGGDNDSVVIAGGVTLDSNGSNMVFRTDDIAFPGSASLTSTGGGTSVTFAGETDATTIGLGTGSAGTLQLTQDELNIVDSTFTEIIVGVDGTQSGTIQVDDSGADNNLTIDNTGLRLRVETAPGDIDINSTITLANTGSDFTIEGAGDTTLLSGDIITDGGDIIINDTVLVDGVRTIDSGNGATATTAGLIQITGDIGSVDTTGDTLTLDARSAATPGYGAVDVIGDVGAGTVNGAAANDLTGFTVFADQVDVANIEVTSGDIALSAVTNIDLNGATYQTTTSGSITIGAELGAGSGTIDLDQAGGTTTMQTAGGAGDDILIESPIRDGDATQLTLNAGAGGDVTADTIGAVTAIGTVDVDGDQISLDNINVDNGDIFVTGNNIDLNSGFTITTAGEINVTGPVLLTGSTSNFTTAGGAGDDITFSSTIDDDSAGENILTLDADTGGGGNVTVGGAIGGITRVRQVDIDGVQIAVNSIRVDGNVADAANIFVGTLGTTTGIDLNGTNYDSINSSLSGIIRFDGPVTLNQGAASTTTVSSTSGADSDITFRGTIDDNGAGNTALVVNSGAAGNTWFQQDVGGTTPIESLTVTNAAQIIVDDVTTTGDQSYTSANIDLAGAAYTSNTAGTISFTGPVELFDNVTVTTAGAGGDNISFSSTIDADDATTNDRALTLTGGTGNVTVTGAIGGTEALDGGVTISGATINTDAITTDGTDGSGNRAGGAVTIDATGGSVTVGGAISAIGLGLGAGGAVDIDADGTNTISVQGITTNNTAVGGIGGIIQLNDDGGTGLVTLNGDLVSGVTANGGAITLGSATELATVITISTGTLIGDITFDSTLDSEASENNTLGLTAGTGNITFTGAVGSGVNQELGAITVNSANDVTVTSTLEAASITQTAGTGTTQFGGQVDTTAAGTNVNVTTTTIDVDDNINTSGGNVVLSAANGITLDGGNIATGGITNAVDTTDNAGSVDMDVTGAGDIALTGLILATGAGSNASAAGDGGLVTLDTFDGDITVNIITASGGAGTGQNGGNAGEIQITAGDNGGSFGDDITIGLLSTVGGAGTVAGSANNVTLTANSGAIVDGNAGGNNVNANVLTIDARDGVATGGALLETNVTSIDIDNSNSGNIEIAEADGLIVTKAAQATDADANDIIITTTTGDIEVDSITTGGVDGDVTLTASAGAVTDRLADTNLDISADVLTIDADTGVGSANALETAAATFDIDNNTSGNIDIDNNYTTGLVTLTNLNVAAGAGTINFDNTGNQSLTITSATTNTGGISITNTGDANTDTLTVGTTVSTAGSGTISLSTLNRGDIAINGGIDASTSGGTITVSAADNMSFGAVTLTTGAGTGQINLNVDSTNTQAATLNLTNATLTSADINLDSGAAGDTLIGQNVANTWTITGADTGTLGNANLSVDADYTDFDNLTGNANSDLFDFNGGTVSGNVDGAGGTNTLDYAGAASGSVTLVATGSTTGFSGTAGAADQISGTYDNITTLVANSTADTLTGIAAGGTFGIDGTNQYVSTNTLDFSGYANLTGGDGADIFNVSTSHTGNLDGARGDDIFNLSVDGTIVTGTLQGGDGDDTFNFSDQARVAGNVDGGIDLAPLTTSDNDVINFSGSTLVVALSISGNGSDHGQTGTILDNGAPNFDLITGTFDNVDSVIGNGGLLVGPNAVTFWNITGADSGTFGGSLAGIGDNLFNSFEIQGNANNDTFVFQNGAGQITGGIDGGAGINTLTGSLGNDAFVISGPNTVTVTPAGSGLATTLTSITNIDGTNATDDGSTTVGDTGVDTFAINQDWSGSLNGAGGADTFTFADTRTVGGTLTGGAGIDIINWNAYTTARNVTITGSAADGFDGNETSITGGFVTIDDIRGSTTGGQVDIITGQNGITATWTVNSGGTQYSNTAGPFNLAFSNFEDLTGGSGADTFNVTGAHSGNLAGGLGDDVFDIAATLTGSVNGEGGSDTLQGTQINTVVLTGSDVSGFDGTEADITGGFDGIDTITGNGGTLTGQDVASTWSLDAAPDYSNGTHTLNFSGFTNLQGGTNTDAFNVTVANAFNLFGGTGVDAFDIDATLTGSLDGEGGADTLQGDQIDAVVLTGSDGDGFAGTETDITGNFDGISVITGNGGTLTGQNIASTWDLDGTPTYNNGTHTLNYTGFANLQGGTNTDAFNVTTTSTFNLLGGGNVDTFDIDAALTGSIDGETGADILQGNLINNVVLTGSDADGFAGTEADISTGFDGITVITGNGGTLTGRNVASTWDLDGTPTYSDGNVLNFTGFANLQGGTNTDAFNIAAASAFNLRGGAGVDTFDVDFALTGLIDGEAGADILQGALISNVVLTGSDADGYAGTEADISGNFDGIQVLTGTNATLTGQNVNGAFNITGGNSGTYAGGTGTLTFTGVQNLTGGTANDSYTFTNAGSIAGSITDNGGTDTLVGDDDGNAFVVTGANTGTLATKITGTWSGIENLTGGAGADTFNVTGGTISGLLNGAGGAGDSATFAGQTVTLNGINTGISNIETVNMGGGTLVGSPDLGPGVDTAWNLNAANGGTANDGTTIVTFTNTPTVRGGTGSDTFTANGAYNGTVNLTDLDNTWNYTPGATLTNGAVTGTGSLTIPGTDGVALDIAGGDLLLPNLAGFTGHTIIGGELTDPGATPYYTATAVDFNTTTLTVTDPINSGGSVTLLGGDVILNNDITLTSGTIGLVAGGPVVVPGSTGIIDASAGPVTLTAPPGTDPSGAFVASDNLVGSENITLAFGGGEVDLATGAGDDVEFNGASISNDIFTDPAFEAFVNGALGALGVNITTTFSINPASALIGLETLAFIDLGLFEEELQLFGTIGTGIALALAQCEEQEGCAPNVTEDELNTLIATLEARIEELRRRLEENENTASRVAIEGLIEAFNKELQTFNDYLAELQAFFSAEAALEEQLEDDFIDEEPLLDEAPDADEVSVLAGVLETIKSRIDWLEGLKEDPEERNRLSEATGIELTLEELDKLIEAARAEAAFIENRIRLLIEGTEARLGVQPIFTAEARNYDDTQVLHYGPGLLQLDNNKIALKGMNIY